MILAICPCPSYAFFNEDSANAKHMNEPDWYYNPYNGKCTAMGDVGKAYLIQQLVKHGIDPAIVRFDRNLQSLDADAYLDYTAAGVTHDETMKPHVLKAACRAL
jgi:hypothetical protein